jgi:hypothetical protein
MKMDADKLNSLQSTVAGVLFAVLCGARHNLRRILKATIYLFPIFIIAAQKYVGSLKTKSARASHDVLIVDCSGWAVCIQCTNLFNFAHAFYKPHIGSTNRKS